MAGPFRQTHLAAATAAVANQFVVSTNMIVGAYSVANGGAMPTAGARRVTVTHTAVGAADTLGTIVVVGTSLNNTVITDTITPLNGTTATGVLYFATVTSITGVGWVINAGNDTITAGCDSRVVVADGSGLWHAININTTAAGAVTIKDATGTIAVLKASIAEGNYLYDVVFAAFLEIVLAAASDVTISAQTY